MPEASLQTFIQEILFKATVGNRLRGITIAQLLTCFWCKQQRSPCCVYHIEMMCYTQVYTSMVKFTHRLQRTLFIKSHWWPVFHHLYLPAPIFLGKISSMLRHRHEVSQMYLFMLTSELHFSHHIFLPSKTLLPLSCSGTT